MHPEVGKDGMVVTQHYLATDIGHAILQKGGNAYDASIAVAFALAVVLPRAGNIGGGGFMLMHDGVTNKNYSIDYREIAPANATKDMYLNADGTVDKKTFHSRRPCYWCARHSLRHVGGSQEIWKLAMERINQARD